MFSKTARLVAVISAAAFVASCALPRSGPNKREIYAGSVQKDGDAFVVTVTDQVSRTTARQPSFGFSKAFQNAGVIGSDTISSGDRLSVVVFENVKEEPLLGNTGQRVTPLNEMQVDGQGYIFIPYAGRVRAAGQTPEGLRQAITRLLEDQTPDPQVQVRRLAGDGSTISIAGQAAGPGIYPIEAPTRTLATMLAKSGGVSIDADVAIVRVTRGAHSGRIWLKDLYENPALDIALRPGDQIVIEEDSRTFTALGATGGQNLVPFKSESLSALEAIATVGGLSTNSADPTGVFVLRDETEDIANAVLGRTDLIGDQRLVYVLDLTEPTGLFEARDFQIRDGDTLYVTEAPFVQWQKTLAAITGTTGAATNLANTGN
ncbi:MAG: polysaccharide biosynthesis/export family protein [Tabrizicola sp.]|uniref:polysaccharide biosynthesis/export family protein n=1 Tax=Tabrizicola sp. TaxID=2005166 RepID=UPI00273414F7|nr:polysaccharide biosynthesis/export family protein [Tabrizicola sp.]MDP3261371.1 polysaccharide biosynthesis/export family protein [Tabrizicola sp.]MDP3649160.1 polysaccharide biosynthesis/export family protein [Paracoccaceae bacterium]MDZ4070001.1 polysaccharide biosynthesis/export family protein [Tabrizicola sp.]